MSLELRTIDLAILNRIKPVTDAIVAYGIKTDSLPKEARSQGDYQPYFVSVVTPQCKGERGENDGIQLINYITFIKISLQNLFGDEADKNALYWVADEIINLLIGFVPFANKGDSRKSLWFDGYDLMRPESGIWECELRFQCTKILTAEIELFNEDDIAESVEVFALDETLKELTALLIERIPKK